MQFIKLIFSSYYNDYLYDDASNMEMNILGNFLISDVRNWFPSMFKEWATNDKLGDACSGNITALEKDGDYIELTDLYSEEEIPTVLRITHNQFVWLLDEWEKVCKSKPKEVIIKNENNEFMIETKY